MTMDALFQDTNAGDAYFLQKCLIHSYFKKWLRFHRLIFRLYTLEIIQYNTPNIWLVGSQFPTSQKHNKKKHGNPIKSKKEGQSICRMAKERQIDFFKIWGKNGQKWAKKTNIYKVYIIDNHL